jgi:hypothetical protein
MDASALISFGWQYYVSKIVVSSTQRFSFLTPSLVLLFIACRRPHRRPANNREPAARATVYDIRKHPTGTNLRVDAEA